MTDREYLDFLGEILDFEESVTKERIRLAKFHLEQSSGIKMEVLDDEDALGWYTALLLKAKHLEKGVDK